MVLPPVTLRADAGGVKRDERHSGSGLTPGVIDNTLRDMAAVTYDEISLHGSLVRYASAGAASGGPVLLLVHGMASRASQWEQVMAVLGERFHVIAPDLLGHGGSAKPRGDYSLGAHACGIRDLLAALGHHRYTVVGHSLGGGIAMQFFFQFPERVERLALISSGGLGPEVSPWLRAAALPGAEYVLPIITGSWVRGAGTYAGGVLNRLGMTVSPGLSESLVGYASLSDPAAREAFVHTVRSVVDVRGQRVDARDRLHLAAHLPMLIVWGQKDSIIPDAHGIALAAENPAARLELFALSGHFPHLTEPGRLAEVVTDWMTTTTPGAIDPATLTTDLRAAPSA